VIRRLAARTGVVGLMALAAGAMGSSRPANNSFALKAPLASLIGPTNAGFHNWVTDGAYGPIFDSTALPHTKRKCRGGGGLSDVASCYVGGARALVAIRPAHEAPSLDIINPANFPQYGAAIGLLAPYQGDQYTERKYKLPANSGTAYFVVEMPSSGVYTWSLVLDNVTSAQILTSGTFHKCSDNVTPTIPYAGFSSCLAKHLAAQVAFQHLAQARTLRDANAIAKAEEEVRKALTDDDSIAPAWFSCYLGCCTAEG
jgi:hypothetical protein